MYLFKATYLNMDTSDERVSMIEFDGQFLNSEQECYIYAMKRAYEGKQPNECLGNVEFIACYS